MSLNLQMNLLPGAEELVDLVTDMLATDTLVEELENAKRCWKTGVENTVWFSVRKGVGSNDQV